MMHPDLLNANQSLTLGLGRDAAASTAKVLVGELQSVALLEDVIIAASQTGLVDDILIAGQPTNCSDLGGDIQAFGASAYCEGHRGLGIPFPKTQKVTVKATLDANGTIVACVNIQAMPGESKPMVQDVSELGSRLHYYFGLGKKNVGAGADAIQTATAIRDCRLGLASFSAVAATVLDLTIRSVKHNGAELMAGRQDSTIDEVPLVAFSPGSTDVDGRCIARDVRVNDKVAITFHNFNVGALDVWGNAFCMPMEELEAA